MKAKGAQPKVRRRGAARADFVLETVFWDAGAARLLPRLLKGRTRGPVFVTHRRPGPGKVLSARDVCPDTGLARLSYGQARALLDQHTALAGPGTGWDLHEWRHSSLTHLGEQGASLLMLMAKSRHKKAENVRRYFKPSAEAIAEVTSLLRRLAKAYDVSLDELAGTAPAAVAGPRTPVPQRSGNDKTVLPLTRYVGGLHATSTSCLPSTRRRRGRGRSPTTGTNGCASCTGGCGWRSASRTSS